MNKDTNTDGLEGSEGAAPAELDDEQLERVVGGAGLLSPSPLAEKLAKAHTTSVWVREVVEDVEAY